MRVAVFALQLALVASDSAVLLQSRSQELLEAQDVATWVSVEENADESESSMEAQLSASLWRFAKAMMMNENDNRAPAFMNLLKTVTKKQADGQEYLEIKPMVTMVMDVARTMIKSGMEMTLPKVHSAMRSTVEATEKMTVTTEELFSDIFLTKGENTEIMDVALAVRTRETALALEKALGSFLPKFGQLASGADAMMTMAQFAAGNAAPKNLVSLQKMQKQTKDMTELIRRGAVQTKISLDRLRKKSILQDGFSKEASLKMKKHAIREILKRVEKYEKDAEMIQDGVTKQWLEVFDTFLQIIPPSPMQLAFKKASQELVLAVDQCFADAVLGATGMFKQELMNRQNTLE